MSNDHEVYNLVVDIDRPTVYTPEDRLIILEVDKFLRSHNVNPISTVANTIFPQDLYRRVGPVKLREKYLATFEALRKKKWGRYFQRMVAWPTSGGAADQLALIVQKMKKQRNSTHMFHNVYELTLYDPVVDAARNMNRQCLSFLSFKLHKTRGVMLTAVYRNHYYIARALGNFIGLGNLMAYVAAEVGTTVGPLTCVSTHAVVDAGTRRSKAVDDGSKSGWTLTQVKGLLSLASKLHEVKTSQNNDIESRRVARAAE